MLCKVFLDNEKAPAFDELFFIRLIDAVNEHVEVGEDTEVSVTFVNDDEIKNLNNQYRGKDKATDVLSFPMDDEKMLGDIVMSIDTAEENAKEQQITLEEEVAFIFVHGFLHLMGYDHEAQNGSDSEEAAEMYALQDSIIYDWEERYR